MLESMEYFSYLLGVEPFWGKLMITLLLLLGVTKSIYPWQPKWKSEETTKDDGSKVTKYYHLDE